MQLAAPTATTLRAAGPPAAPAPAPAPIDPPAPTRVGDAVAAFPMNFNDQGWLGLFVSNAALQIGGQTEFNSFNDALAAAKSVSGGRDAVAVGVFQRGGEVRGHFTVEQLLVPDAHHTTDDQSQLALVPMRRQHFEVDGRPGWGDNLMRAIVGFRAGHADLRAVVAGEALPTMTELRPWG